MATGNQTHSVGRGGKRQGAGRKYGSLSQKTREIAERASEEGITPLEYMLQILRRPCEHEDPMIQRKMEELAFEAAKAAAPYMHPRLAAVEHTGRDGDPIDHSISVEFVSGDSVRKLG